jgi:hypothetical protein
MFETLAFSRLTKTGNPDYSVFIQMLRNIYESFEDSMAEFCTEYGIDYSGKDSYPDKYPVDMPWGGFNEKKSDL